MKRVITFILVFCLLASLGSAFADSSGSRAVIGADLTDEQVTAVYYWFGIDRGEKQADPLGGNYELITYSQ